MNISDDVFALSWVADELFKAEGIENRLPVIGHIDGPWTRLCRAITWKEALALGADASALSCALEAYNGEILSQIKQLEPDERVVIADDICSGAGWLLEPAVARGVLMPLYECYVNAFDRMLGFHSDGNISELFPDLSAAGFHFVHLASVNYVDLPAIVHSAQAHALVPYGGVSTETISQGPLSSALRAMLAELVQDQGLIVCDDAGLTTGEQLDAFLLELSSIPLY